MKSILTVVIILIALFVSGNYFYAEDAVKTDTTTLDSPVEQIEKSMSFFVTSVNPGKGADLGGLAGADGYCALLAEKAGVMGKQWNAYLSTTGAGGEDARDRIGNGP